MRKQQHDVVPCFLLPILILAIVTEGWVQVKVPPIIFTTGTKKSSTLADDRSPPADELASLSCRRCRRRPCQMIVLHASKSSAVREGEEKESDFLLPDDMSIELRSISETLWGGKESLDAVLMKKESEESESGEDCARYYQGEMPLPPNVPHSQRYSYFLQQAQSIGDPRAQHSVGLLLWNGFAAGYGNEETPQHNTTASIDPEASAKWHAAAAIQGNIDAVAVLGGCLRTGTGVGKKKCKNIPLGWRCIEFAASVGNPSGINKKGAMMESNDDYAGARRLYGECYEDETKRVNALLLFNLGYCLVVHGGREDTNNNHNREDDILAGIELWKRAVDLAPEEGSEEAAWFLYQHYVEKGDGVMAAKFLGVGANLGHLDAVLEQRTNGGWVK